MWAANQALNDVIGAGAPRDWSTHMIGHAITTIYGVDHARSLTMVIASVLRNEVEMKSPVLAGYPRRAWNIDQFGDRAAAEAGIAATENFFERIGCPVRTAEAHEGGLDEEAVIAHIEAAGQFPLGENGSIGASEVHKILERAA